jgi:hypothetical protein
MGLNVIKIFLFLHKLYKGNSNILQKKMDEKICTSSTMLRRQTLYWFSTECKYSKLSIIRPGHSRLLEFEKNIVLVVFI